MNVSRKSPRHTPLPMLFLGAVLSLLLLAQQSLPRSQARNTQAKHITEELKPLCLALLPEEDKLQIFAAPPDPSFGNTARRNLWSVDCYNAQGEPRLHLLWQEDRKLMVWLTRYVSPDAPQARENAWKEELDQEQAVQTARQLAFSMGLARDEDAKACDYAVKRMFSRWCVRLSLPIGKTTINLDAHSGEVQLAYVHDACPPEALDIRQS